MPTGSRGAEYPVVRVGFAKPNLARPVRIGFRGPPAPSPHGSPGKRLWAVMVRSGPLLRARGTRLPFLRGHSRSEGLRGGNDLLRGVESRSGGDCGHYPRGAALATSSGIRVRVPDVRRV